MSDEIQQNRYDQIIRRVTGIIGPGSKVAEVITELFPMVDVERVPGELLRLGGTNISYGGTITGPNAAAAARIQLFNPADSGAIITVSSVIVSSPDLHNIRWAIVDTALTTNVGVQRFRDSRGGVTSQPIGQVRAQLDASFTPAQAQARLAADEHITFDDSNGVGVLTEGFGLEFGSGVNNTTLLVSFMWRERPAVNSELNL